MPPNFAGNKTLTYEKKSSFSVQKPDEFQEIENNRRDNTVTKCVFCCCCACGTITGVILLYSIMFKG